MFAGKVAVLQWSRRVPGGLKEYGYNGLDETFLHTSRGLAGVLARKVFAVPHCLRRRVPAWLEEYGYNGSDELFVHTSRGLIGVLVRKVLGVLHCLSRRIPARLEDYQYPCNLEQI